LRPLSVEGEPNTPTGPGESAVLLLILAFLALKLDLRIFTSDRREKIINLISYCIFLPPFYNEGILTARHKLKDKGCGEGDILNYS
jgi:hypothetical protein